MATSFCAVPLPGFVYAGPKTKEEFDRIPLPVTVHEWKPDSTETMLRNDGLQYERRCHSKSIESTAPDTLMVIFQWFEARVAETPEMPA